ncbi:MAG: chemotaxis protein CheW [Pseudomonadales bacterium]|jgi:chemosensory pili system protein ChpC|nr:chemotaxis protein CheW [Pseudomonadales bacterium]MDP6469470.1 chemotaxis protein CheW [Pseudomonadales bacterium]MDP6827312.1 chemotaxis protein CheW [Pseudomonadales bacterium]MDP6971135.1 chemotaxis protein CheW [Pseudomonadales bacterium]|tara:strand:+ start:216 stop:689 length:474 start_codon:yes stop_codon:yes gene_type:complete
MSALPPEALSELSCVMIPIGQRSVVLPNECVAEILPWRRVRPYAKAPQWCLGHTNWRGEEVPVVRFDLVNGSDEDPELKARCVVIMNRVRSSGLPRFYALVASGLPRIFQLTDDDVTTRSASLGQAETLAVNIGAEEAVVPNLEFLEAQVHTILIGS